MRKLSALGLAAAMTLASVGSALAVPVSGSLNVKLDHVKAVKLNGSPDPAKDAACADKYRDFIGIDVSAKYNIDKTTGIMDAKADVLGIVTDLHPLGIEGQYDFMSDGVPQALADKGISREILDMSEDLSQKAFILLASFDKDSNCIITGHN
ncbi:hypothetical protein E1162_18290 [Rhodobacteraceae bacterium RKSG542]|uniref:hypothetical protein n=1 Tax=Pseudovibrio flavus TaxID=2529854 RepID=UPI0012BC07F1|nr:hypothetical protein [Pseudovibrio flavus]MTI19196.1 hypothetical protein [Pseudovibrio flavus]